MEQEKIGKFIKDIRIKNNLTQKDLADRYGVTYQAVSKWENGKNIPDIMILKQICEDFDVNIDDILNGKVNDNKKNNKKLVIIISFIILIFVCVILLFVFNRSNSFEFKTISSNCSDFTISGSMAYNKDKSSIYISDVSYCGNENNNRYSKIECILYENNDDTLKKISMYDYDGDDDITLDEFFKNVKFNVDNYTSSCTEYKENSLYLIVDATDKDNNVISYKIPLSLQDNCLIKK